MHEFIARLIKAGMPRKIAAFVCSDYNRRGKMAELAQYVDAVERETYGEVGDVERKPL